MKTTPYRRDRVLLLIGGSISSSTITGDWSSIGKNSITNDYLFTLSALKFMKERLGFGLQFMTGRNENDEFAKLESEILSVGPWIRYYFTNSPVGSLYPQIALTYTNYFSTRELNTQNLNYNEYLRGKGFGTLFSLGYSYVISDQVNLEVGLLYNLYFLFGSLENELEDSKTRVDFLKSQVAMNISFGILLDKRSRRK